MNRRLDSSSGDSWFSQKNTGPAFWFLKNNFEPLGHQKFLRPGRGHGPEASKQYPEDYVDTEESESIYATKVL